MNDYTTITLKIHKNVLRDLMQGMNVAKIACALYGIRDAFLAKLCDGINEGKSEVVFCYKDDQEKGDDHDSS